MILDTEGRRMAAFTFSSRGKVPSVFMLVYHERLSGFDPDVDYTLYQLQSVQERQ